MRAKIVKNKVAPPFRQAEFDIEYGVGISSEGCLIDLGIEHGIVQKSGAFFSYDGERLGQGRNNAKAFLRENAAIASEIEEKIYEKLGIERPGAPKPELVEAAAGARAEPEAANGAEPAAAGARRGLNQPPQSNPSPSPPAPRQGCRAAAAGCR